MRDGGSADGNGRGLTRTATQHVRGRLAVGIFRVLEKSPKETGLIADYFTKERGRP